MKTGMFFSCCGLNGGLSRKGFLGNLAVLAGGALLGSSLFGGGGKTTGQSIQQADIKTPEQLAMLDRLIRFAMPQIGQPGQVPPSGLGPLPPSALQEQAFGLAGQMPNLFAGGIQEMMAPVSEFAQQQFQERTIPSIMGALGSQGMARSSGAAEMLGRAGTNLGMGMAAQFAPMQFGLEQARAQLPGQMANIGTLQRGIGGERQAFDLSRFMQQDPFRAPAVNLGLQTLGIPTTENIAFQGYRQPSIFESILPAAGQIGMGAMMGGFFG